MPCIDVALLLRPRRPQKHQQQPGRQAGRLRPTFRSRGWLRLKVELLLKMDWKLDLLLLLLRLPAPSWIHLGAAPAKRRIEKERAEQGHFPQCLAGFLSVF
jgi:hypothetical protein